MDERTREWPIWLEFWLWEESKFFPTKRGER